jgi:hypothetical protein
MTHQAIEILDFDIVEESKPETNQSKGKNSK